MCVAVLNKSGEHFIPRIHIYIPDKSNRVEFLHPFMGQCSSMIFCALPVHPKVQLFVLLLEHVTMARASLVVFQTLEFVVPF